MGKDDKAALRATLSQNFAALVEARKGTHSALSWRHEDIAQRAGIGKGSVGRAAKGSAGTRLDTLAGLGKVFGIPAWALLVPGLRATETPLYTTREQDTRVAEATRLLLEAQQDRDSSPGPHARRAAHRSDSGPKPPAKLTRKA